MSEPFPFTPVRTAYNRHDGWTAPKQRLFIARLAECGPVSAAAGSVGMSPKSAYALRKRPDAGSFAAAWDDAVLTGQQAALLDAYDRAVNGTLEPIFYRGRQVGERRHRSDRLLIAALRHAKPERFR